MKKTKKRNEKPPGDHKLEIAKLIAISSEPGILAIKELYPEYFSLLVEPGSLEFTSEVNSSYTKWVTDYGINREWIGEFPTNDIYNNYMRYCIENRYNSMDKSRFYKTLENDFCYQ
jgi:hypothetical protein